MTTRLLIRHDQAISQPLVVALAVVVQKELPNPCAQRTQRIAIIPPARDFIGQCIGNI